MSGRRRAGLSRISSNREEFPGCRSTAPFRQSAAYIDRSIASEIENTVSFHYSEVKCTRGRSIGTAPLAIRIGAVAHLGERRLCKAEVGGSSPPSSTMGRLRENWYSVVCLIARLRRQPIVHGRSTLPNLVPQYYRLDEIPHLPDRMLPTAGLDLGCRFISSDIDRPAYYAWL